jgi:hypothetical protein
LDFFAELSFGEAEVFLGAELSDVRFGGGFMEVEEFGEDVDLGFGLAGRETRFL